MMKYLFLLVILPCVVGEICLRLLQKEQEVERILKKPGYVWRWNAITEEFEKFEVLKWNNTAFCTVTPINDVREKTLNVTFETIHPYIMIDNKNNLTGIIGDAWTTLEETLKFKTIYQEPKQLPNTTSLQTVMNADVHALLMPIGIYSFLPSYHYTYSIPLATDAYALFVQSENITKQFRYINIFNYYALLMSMIIATFVAFTITGIYRIKKRIFVNYKYCNDELSLISFSFLYILSVITNQGSQKMPSCWSIRLTILSLLIMQMLIVCKFSSALTAYLANVEKVSVNLQDVVNRRYSLCLRKHSIAYRHFTEIDDLQAAWKGLINNNCPDMENKKTLVSQICRPGLVYLEVPSAFLSIYQQVKHNCHIIQQPDKYWKFGWTILHTKISQHRRLIDTYLLRMRSAGIMKYLEQKWIQEEICYQDNQLNFKPIEFIHIYNLLLFFSLFVHISAFICILENVWYKLQLTEKFSMLLNRCKKYNNLNEMKVCHKAKSKYKRSRKFNSKLLSKYIYKRSRISSKCHDVNYTLVKKYHICNYPTKLYE